MSSNNATKTDLWNIYNVVQASMIVYPKEIIIATLRNFFSHDNFYHHSIDSFGYPNITNHTDLPLGADLPSGPGAEPKLSPTPILASRLFIGENYHQAALFYPAILVKHGGSRSVPISINRNQGEVAYKKTIFVDGYGNEAFIYQPEAFLTAGAWEGSIIIDVLTRSLRARDDLVELVAMCFTEIHFETLHQIGIVVKPISIGTPTETDDRNDKLFRQSLTLDIRSEWERRIPIGNTIDTILFTADFANLLRPDDPKPSNLTINTEINIVDILLGL